MLKLKSFMLLAACTAFLMTVSSSANAQGANGTIYICVSLNNWQLRHVSNPSECKRNEVSVLWNIKGQKGDKGDPGPAGPAGRQGLAGPQGPKGDKGNTGLTGPQGAKGDKGDTGVSGPAGATGAAGPQGYSIKTYMDNGAPYPLGCGTAGGLVLVVVDAEGNQIANTSPQYVCNGRQGDKGDKGDTGAQGAPGLSGGGASEVYYTKTRVAGFNGEIVSGATSGGFVEMATLTLPEGSYLVYANAGLRYFPRAGVTDPSSLICKVSDGTIAQEIRPQLQSPNPPGNSDFLVSATLPLTFGPGGGTARWACSGSPNDAAHGLFATSVQVWAIKVSALHIQ
jgi:hypothetical protein